MQHRESSHALERIDWLVIFMVKKFIIWDISITGMEYKMTMKTEKKKLTIERRKNVFARTYLPLI